MGMATFWSLSPFGVEVGFFMTYQQETLSRIKKKVDPHCLPQLHSLNPKNRKMNEQAIEMILKKEKIIFAPRLGTLLT